MRLKIESVDDQGGPAGQLRERLRSSADRIALLHEELAAEQQRRDGLVTELRDTGASWSAVASAARLSITRCVTIVVASSAS